MQTKTMSLLCALFMAGLTVFAATDVTLAQAPLSPADPQPPQTTCTMKGLLGSSVTVVAGPDGTPFPETLPCPAGFGNGQCKKWRYKWTFTNMQGLSAGVSVDSDIAVLAADPTNAQVAPLIPFFGEGERFIKFPLAKVTSFTGAVWTGPDVGIGTLTAGFVGTKGIGHCRIAGADNPVFIPEPNQAVNKQVVSLAEDCVITRTIDVAGRTISLSVTSGSCEAEGLKTLGLVGHQGAVFISGETQITTEGSTRYCWPSATTGKMTCVIKP